MKYSMSSPYRLLLFVASFFISLRSSSMFALKAMRAVSRASPCRSCFRASRFSLPSLLFSQRNPNYVVRSFGTSVGHHAGDDVKKTEHLREQKQKSPSIDINMMSTGEACELLRSRALSFPEVRIRLFAYAQMEQIALSFAYRDGVEPKVVTCRFV